MIVAFPDVEAFLVRVLRDVLDVPVSTRVPADRPPAFVRLVRVGGTRRDVVTDLPMVTFECWALSETRAADLGREVRARVHALAQTEDAGDYVRAVSEVGGLQAFPDPTSKTPRYVFTVQIQTRGVPL